MMRAGNTAQNPMKPVINRAPRRGQTFVARANSKPTPAKSKRFDSGTNQMKCRLSM